MRIVIDDQPAGTAYVGPDGTWSLETRIDDVGDYEIRVEALDEDEAVVAASQALAVSRIAPDLPPPPPVAPTLAVAQTETEADTVALSGTASPNAAVQVLINGDPAGVVDADADGNWTFDAALPAFDDYQVSALALDDNADPVAISNIATVSRIQPIDAPTLAVAETEITDQVLAVSGTGTPNALVQIQRDGQAINTVQVDADGTWNDTLLLPDLGSYNIAALALDPQGQIAATSDVVAVSRIAPPEPPTVSAAVAETTADTVALTGTGTPNTALNILINGQRAGATTIDADGQWAFDAPLDALGTFPISAETVTPDQTLPSNTVIVSRIQAIDAPTLAANASETTADTVQVSGTGTAGTGVRVLVDGESVGTAQVNAEGNWAIVAVPLPAPGDYEITAQALDRDGNPAADAPAVVVSRLESVVAPHAGPGQHKQRTHG